MHGGPELDALHPMVPLAEAANLLECGEERIVELLKAGDLPGLKLGRGWVMPRRAFFERINELAVTAAALRRQKTAAAPQPFTPVGAAVPVGQKRRPGRPRLR